MSSSGFPYSEDDVALSKFALALGLPVRVYIIRTIVQQNNLAGKSTFAAAPFSAELISKHIAQLKGLGILHSHSAKGVVTYSIDKLFFGMMSQKFNLLFESLRDINAPQQKEAALKNQQADPENTLNFGAYLKTQRLSFQLSQQVFSDRLNIERAKLSKIETGKAIFPGEKLEELCKLIHEDMAKLKKIYYSDHLVTLLRDGSINEDTFKIARRKADQ